MGARLASFYEQAEAVGGLEAKIRLAILTRIPSTRAHVEPDSPENIARFEGALAALRSENKPKAKSGLGNEALLLGVLSSLHDAMVAVFDRDAHCLLAWDSRSLEARYGAIGEQVAKEVAEQRGLALRQVFAGGKAAVTDLKAKLGTHDVWFSVTLSPVHDEQGQITAVAAFGRVTEAAARTLDVARASIWFYDSGKTGITCIDLFEKESNKHSDGVVLAAKDFPAYFKGLLQERTIAADDAHTHPMTREFSEVYLKPLGIHSMLDVPIWVEGEMVGVVCHEHVGPARKWTPDEENFAYLMGTIAALIRAHMTR